MPGLWLVKHSLDATPIKLALKFWNVRPLLHFTINFVAPKMIVEHFRQACKAFLILL